MPQLRHATHVGVPPLVDGNSHTLVLGSMLSPKSAEAGFYYMHPQNRFWRVLAAVFDSPYPAAIEDKRSLALKNGIALWDVILSCDILGASDSSIKNAVCNDIKKLLSDHPKIARVFTAGRKAAELLKRYNADIGDKIIAASICLPSPSPLNCAVKTDELIRAYSVLKQ